MKLTATLLLISAPLLAQTSRHATYTANRSHTAVHRTAMHHTRYRSRACNAGILLSPRLPALPSSAPCAKPLYSLSYVDIKRGTGDPVEFGDDVTVQYTGYLPNGTKFDSSYDHPGQAPYSFIYGRSRVIAGWNTGFTGMKPGGKRRLFIPYQLAYGDSGRPPTIPPKSALIFDIELISATPPAPFVPPAPPTSPAPAPVQTTPASPDTGISMPPRPPM